MSQDLKQDEIDHLLESIKGDTDFDSVDSAVDQAAAAEAIIKRSKTVHALSNRLYFAMESRAGLEVIIEARRNFHNEAFGLWCANRGIDKAGYYAIIKRELKKRGLRYAKNNPPGFRLVMV